jgi:hypothetical protein
MEKYITKEEYIQRIKDREEHEIHCAEERAEIIADQVTRTHPYNNGMDNVFVKDYFDSDKRLKIIENKLHELLPFLKFKFTPIEECANGIKYRVRWTLREDKQ